MEPIVYEAKVIKLKLNDEEFLALDMTRELGKAQMSFPIAEAQDPRFRHLLGKKVKITIQEKGE
jgi:hypothetical protein